MKAGFKKKPLSEEGGLYMISVVCPALFEGGGTRDDLGELGGDLCLTHAVELAFEQVSHLARVVGRGFHRHHSGDVL